MYIAITMWLRKNIGFEQNNEVIIATKEVIVKTI